MHKQTHKQTNLSQGVDSSVVWHSQVLVDVEVARILFAGREDLREAVHRGVGHAESFLETLLKRPPNSHHLQVLDLKKYFKNMIGIIVDDDID